MLLLTKDSMWGKLLYIKQRKVHWKLYPLNLISMLKSKISLSIFTPLSFNFNADFQKFNAEIPFTPSYLELCLCTFISVSCLSLKAPSKICSRRQSKIFLFYFSEKTSLDISCESSAWQMIHMNCQDLFSSENKKKIKIVICFSSDWRFKG